MNPKLENMIGCSVLLAFLILPVVLFFGVVAHGKIVSGKQVTIDRARESLSAALGDVHAGDGAVVPSKQYGYFLVFAYTNTVIVNGSNYPLAFTTGDEDYYFARRGRLAITTNRQFIWLDYRRGAKFLPDDYKVPQWRTGF